MAASSFKPTWASRLATFTSGAAPGRIGSSAGPLGSRGTPTSMRGRFAKVGGRFGDEAGARAALMTTHEAANAQRSGLLDRTARESVFDPAAYEAQERQRRGMTATAAAPVAKPAAPKKAPMMSAANAAKPATPPKAAPVTRLPSEILKPRTPTVNWSNTYNPNFGAARPYLSPAKFNLGSQHSTAFQKRNAKVGVT